MAFREKSSHTIYICDKHSKPTLCRSGIKRKKSQMSLQRFCTLLSAFNLNIILIGQLEGNILQEFNPIENNSNIMTK